MGKKNYGSAIMETLIKGIQEWGGIQGERNKLMGQILANEIKMRRNFLYNIMEKEHIGPYQRWMQQEYQKQGGMMGGVDEGRSAESFMTSPRVVPGTSGFKMEMPSREAQLYGHLKMKEKAGKLDKDDEAMLRGLQEKIFGTPYKAVSEWEMKNAQKTLFDAYLDDLQGQFEKGEKWYQYAGPMESPAEHIRRYKQGRPVDVIKGKLNVDKFLGRLGKSRDDFYTWAQQKNPELARIAFPGREMLQPQ
jgi:hypothetical protein